MCKESHNKLLFLSPLVEKGDDDDDDDDGDDDDDDDADDVI